MTDPSPLQPFKPSGEPSPAVAKDPVCGMTVDTKAASLKFEHAGRTYYFCSRSCMETFRANPVKYVPAESSRSKASATAAPAQYTCPMHPEIRQDPPGTCPKCGMTLEPITPAQPASK